MRAQRVNVAAEKNQHLLDLLLFCLAGNDAHDRQQASKIVLIEFATEADIRYGGNQAYYQPAGDFIQMPNRHQFSTPDFYDALLHELCHWTEHQSRLNWDRTKPENTYALGELIAELGACFLAGELGLPLDQSLGNHAAYLKNWLESMQGDTRFIFRASSQASKAADFILSFSRKEEAGLVREPAIII